MPVEAPPAPAAPPAAPPVPVPPPTPSGGPAPSPTPQPTPKPGSAKDRLFSDMQKYAEKKATTPKDDTVPAPAKSLEPKADDKPAAPAAGDKPPEKKEKPNPWHLYEEQKARAKELETRIAELEGKVMKPEQQKEWESKTARLKELEEEIRYTNYTKSQEFQDKYQKPYDAAWKRAMGDLSELTVPDGDGGQRQMAPQDLLDIVNLPLQEARKLAVERFGDFADDAMAHRKEIRRLFDDQAAAIESAKKDGEARDKRLGEERNARATAITKEVQEAWNGANESAKTDEKYGRYFTPVDGDQEGNQRLAKGFELADRAFGENPMLAKDADERRGIVQRHAAVRNRAAAFGRLAYWNGRLEERVKELEAEVAKYTGAEPPAGGSAPAKGDSKPTKAWDRFNAEFEKYAKK